MYRHVAVSSQVAFNWRVTSAQSYNKKFSNVRQLEMVLSNTHHHAVLFPSMRIEIGMEIIYFHSEK